MQLNYKPGRTPDEFERERMLERLRHTPTQRFRIMMDLIRLSEKLRHAKITHVERKS